MRTSVTKKMGSSMRALPIVAQAIGASMGVKVIFESHRQLKARTDGKVIYLSPHIGNFGDNEMVEILNGLLDHEAAHVRFTDFNEVGKCRTPFTKKCQNILEDIRIEDALPRCYPGTKENLKKTATHLKGYFELNGVPGMASIMLGWLVTSMRSEILDQDALSDIADQWKEKALEAFGQKVMNEVMSLAKTCVGSPTTRDCRVIAEKIEKKLKELQKENEQSEKNQGDGDESDQSDSQDQDQNQSKKSEQGNKSPEEGEESSEADCGDSEDASSSEGQDSDEGGSGGSGKDSDSGSGDDSSDSGGNCASAGDEPDADEIAKAISEALGAGEDEIREFAETSEHLAEKMESESKDTIETDRVVDAFKSRKGQFKPSVGCLSGTRLVVNRIDALLQAKTLDLDYSSSAGKLNTRRFCQVEAGRLDVFTKRDEAPGLDTAVVCVVDQSGSMSSCMQKAVDATGMVAECLNRHAVPFSLASFDDAIYPIKQFHEGWKSVGQRLNFIAAHGGTQMGSATQYAVRELFTRRESRRVFLLVTDGQPASFDALNLSVEECRKYGLEVRVVVIGSKTDAERFASKVAVNGCAYAENTEMIPWAIYECLKESV